ncbi:hypothetical protein BDV26DRAFT_113539 [Aspergillus bertholletiae]|uniref:Uncharacterized protein n=1 Tax=Aspergillus bertholletiae TaxID=1226010 RepID=A0A5N7APX5_9EURO|nr:hypothetical protein BDV26DRAFT_113539 [Aspergillus bertholletiae]
MALPPRRKVGTLNTPGTIWYYSRKRNNNNIYAYPNNRLWFRLFSLRYPFVTLPIGPFSILTVASRRP